MSLLYGPWTTAMHSGAAARLSTFWKRRMAMLSGVSRSRSGLTRRAVVLLLLVGATVCALPTLQIAPAAAEPADAKATDKKPTGRIYVNVIVQADDAFQSTIVAIESTTGKWKRVCDGAGTNRVRVSPDKKTLGFGKHEDGVWTCATQKDSLPGRVFDRGRPACWSPDGKQIIVHDGKFEEGTGWRHEAWRMNADGTDVIKLTIPETEEINDWSPDGKWIVTVSDRHEPKGSGYQLYVMKADGTQERRLTKAGGLNVYARFSPDSRKVVYVHHEKGISSVWTVNIDGTDAKEILKEEGLAGIDGACWSPDGKQVLVARFDWELDGDGKKFRRPDSDDPCRLEIMDADGKNGKELKLELTPIWVGKPEWR